MTHASTSGSEFAPPANLVRLSVGLESAEDLTSDLIGALESISG
jgi:cystathionine gamma-synthase